MMYKLQFVHVLQERHVKMEEEYKAVVHMNMSYEL